MDNDLERRLTQLKEARESGLLDEDTYQMAVQAALEKSGPTVDSGALATEGSTAVGEGGVNVGGDVGRDVVTGTKEEHHHHAPVPPGQIKPAVLRRRYLERLLAERNQILVGGIDPKAITDGDKQLDLNAVYTALLTMDSEKEAIKEMRRPERGRPHRLSALEQFNRHGRLVLLGDPGSGKSTFVNFSAVCLAGELLENKRCNLARLTEPLPADEEARGDDNEPRPQPWDHGGLLPVCVVLRDLAAGWLPPAGQKATVAHLWRFLEAELEKAGLDQAVPLLQKALQEEGGVFFFDGLDEVPAAEEHRVHIRQLVEDVAKSYPDCRILVTSRTYAYQNQDWRLQDFAETVLAPFSRGQIERFIARWYEQVSRVRHLNVDDAQGRAVLLRQAVFSSRRLLALAERPLLLTLMASLHAWRGGNLPEKREELYADSVDLLLELWERQRVVRGAEGQIRVIQPSLAEWLKVDRDRVRALLNRLAYEAHTRQPDLVGTADIAEGDLAAGLLNLSRDRELRQGRLVDFLVERAGLLLPWAPGVYTFPHRTFQEYLAACHLTGDEYYPQEVARLAREKPNRWREVALLAGAKATAGSTYALWGLVEELSHSDPAAGGEADHWGALLAGQFLLETANLDDLSPARRKKVDEIRGRLVEVLGGSTLPATERAAAGRHLARLGDPRPEVLDVDQMRFCFVPPGDFYMGESQLERVSFLDKPYWLGLYPVTVAQYDTFVAAGGYGQADWWDEAVQAGLWEDGTYNAYGQRRSAPWDYGPAFALPNQPVVGISWYEALAFSRWLTDRWRRDGWLPRDWQVTLPSEAEWEKAARGGLTIPAVPWVRALQSVDWTLPGLELVENPAPERSYPWGAAAPTLEQANYDAGEIGQTSAAGCFNAAAGPLGCREMAGNVFEWTRSLKKEYPYVPDDGRETLARRDTDWTIIRGGSWRDGEHWLQCGARVDHDPDLDYGDFGVRLALSPC